MSESNGNGKNSTSKLMSLKKVELVETINNYDLTVEALQESLVDAQLAAEDVGWRKLSWDGQDELLSAQQIIEVIQLTRIAWLMNPLINHAVNVQANYVFGQGASIRAKPGEDANEVLQAFWDNPQNQKVLTGPIALWNKEVQLRTEGNIFFVLFPNISNGEVIVRTIAPEEFILGGIIFNPEDRDEPWFYHRIWSARDFNLATGRYSERYEVQEGFYPDIQFNPVIKPPFITVNRKEIPVFWNSPIKHVKVGNIEGQPYGVPEVFSALNWARAVKLDLEDYATLRRALARFAWNLKTKGGKPAVAAAKLKLASALTAGGKDSNPPPNAGSTFIGDADKADMQPMRLAGATPSPEEGRRLWLMVSAGTGIPETILSGNADVGSLATARTLDRPTELQMRTRQTLWETVLKEIGMYVLGQSAVAPSGQITGDFINGVLELQSRTRAPSGRGRPRITGQQVQIEVNFPPILERNKKENVDAVVDAITLSGRKPKGVFSMADIRRRLLQALQEPDIDGALAKLEQDLEEDGPFPTDVGPENQQPSGEQVRTQGPSTRERVTNNEFADES